MIVDESSLTTRDEVLVRAGRKEAWELLSDFEGVWEPSNPAHRGTKVLDEPKTPIRGGLRWWQREKVGHLTGEFTATVHDVDPGRRFSWTALATYRVLGFSLLVDEGGRFEILDAEEGIRLRHALWGRPRSRAVRFLARHVLSMERAMSKHNRVELEYFRTCLEAT